MVDESRINFINDIITPLQNKTLSEIANMFSIEIAVINMDDMDGSSGVFFKPETSDKYVIFVNEKEEKKEQRFIISQ